ncbi:MAG: ribosomal protein S18-alanine N-acetyltransferase [Synechococcales cyanobacterium CRU_2_2]|nr:ribosomal protein S18-alanine N-acetyltransferase [Synechococcales cyanobacterium CRU_2_2]
MQSPGKTLSLQALSLEQLDAVLELDRRCLGGIWSESGYEREIESPNSDLLVLCLGERLIALGCLWAILEEGHITLLGVAPEFQHQGLGQFLLCVLLREAYLRRLEWATLEVRASNAAAIALYHKLGFQSLGERRGYYSDGENALILWHRGLRQPDYLLELGQHYSLFCDRLRADRWCLDNILPEAEFSNPAIKS